MIIVAGSLNYDITLYVDKFAPPKSIVRNIKRFLGGSGGNAAVAAARILGKNKVFLLSAVGNDEVGKAHLIALKNEGINTSLIKVFSTIESGQAFVIIDKSGESAIYSYYGANYYLSPNEVGKNLEDVLDKVTHVLIMNPPLPVAVTLAKLARSKNKIILWDPGILSNLGFNQLAEVIKSVDYLLPNKEELLILTDSGIEDKALEKLASLNPELTIIIKEGSHGVKYINLRNRKTYRIGAVPLHKLGLELISTVGCGDTLVGVFTALKSMGYDDLKALKLSICAAAINASKDEPRGSPYFSELIKFYKHRCSSLINTEMSECNI